MEKLLKELQDLIIEMIKNEEYKVDAIEIDNSHLNICIEIEEFFFSYAIPMDKSYLVELSTPVRLKSQVFDNKELATILFDRHFEPIKNEKIQKKIAELQKQLK